MHSFMRAVGFSKVETRNQLDQIFTSVIERPTIKKVSKQTGKVTLAELSYEYAENMGITIRGEYDDQGTFHLDHYFPYYKGNNTSVKEDLIINKRVDTDSYTGMCDDTRLGVSLIFFLQNVIDFMNAPGYYPGEPRIVPVRLCGLALEGKILLGVDTTKKHSEKTVLEAKKRNDLIAEAKLGNQEAMESLTLDDIDLFAQIAKRVKTEDVYSIVETSFVPFGAESDNYSLIGTIVDFNLVENKGTKEQIYQLSIDCNDILFGICINKEDLLGEPMIGRRFKANIWMQGFVDFNQGME